MPDEPTEKPETSALPEEQPEEAEASRERDDAMSPEAIAKRVAALGGDDEVERLARDEEIKLAERRAKAGGKAKRGLEASASKRLQKIGGKVPPKRVAYAADADVLLGGSGAFGTWFRANQKAVLAASALVLVAAGCGGAYAWWTQRAELAASNDITQAVQDENGRIGDPAKDDDDDSPQVKNPRPVFKTEADRRDAALAKYRDVEAKYKGTGAAYLARLEEGSLLLDKPDLDGAIAALADASKSPLAAADAEVKGRALEGLGFAYEAKATATPAEKDKWLDEAAQQFRALENTDVKGFKELGMYHQARVAEAKGEKDKAIQLLKSLHERLAPPAGDAKDAHPFVYLETVAEDRLRQLDPTALPPKARGIRSGRGGWGEQDERGADPEAHRATEAPAGRWRSAGIQVTNARFHVQPRASWTGGVRRTVRVAQVALGLSMASLVSCAATTANDRVNPEVPLWYHRASGSMHVYLDRELTAPTRQVGESYEHGKPAIDPLHGRIFVGSSDRGLYALRAADGKTIWRFETLGVVQCEPLYDPQYDIVYFGSHDGALYAVQARNGALLWRFSTGAEVSRHPVIGGPRGSILFVANGADQLFALERATGKQLWTVHRTPALGMEIAAHAGPSTDGDSIFMAYSDGHVAAYDPNDGSERWAPVDLSAEAEQSLGDAPRYLDVDTTPLVDDGPNGKVVYVASYAGGVFALDAKSGSRVWMSEKAIGATELLLWQEPAHEARNADPGAGLPIVPAKRILVASSGVSGLWGLEPGTGKKIWRLPVPEGGITAAASISGALMVGTTRYGLFLMSPLDGRPIDGIDLGTGFAETPAAYGNRGFIMSNAGTFLGILVDDPLAR